MPKLELPDIIERDERTPHIVVGGMPHVLVGTSILAGLASHMIKIIGYDMTGRFLYDSTKGYLRNLQNTLIDSFGIKRTDEEFLVRVAALPFYLSAYGFCIGNAEIDREKQTITLKLRESFIAKELTEEGYDRPICHFLAGAFAGFAEAWAGEECSCIETKCMAMGHPHCEFEVFKGSLKDLILE